MSVKWKDETRGRKSVKTYPRRNKHIRALAQNAHAQMGWWPCNGMAISKSDFCEERKQIAILKWRFRRDDDGRARQSKIGALWRRVEGAG